MQAEKMQLLCNRFSARKLEKEGRHYTNSIVTLFCYCSKAENYKNVTVPQVHIFAVVVVQLSQEHTCTSSSSSSVVITGAYVH